MDNNSQRESQSPEDWVADVLSRPRPAYQATPQQKSVASSDTLSAIAASRERIKRALRRKRAKSNPKSKVPKIQVPSGDLSIQQKGDLRQKFWGARHVDPKTASRVVDKLLA